MDIPENCFFARFNSFIPKTNLFSRYIIDGARE